MDALELTVTRLGKDWCIRIVDEGNTRFVGGSDDKRNIEALALLFAEDAWRSGRPYRLSIDGPEKAAA